MRLKIKMKSLYSFNDSKTAVSKTLRLLSGIRKYSSKQLLSKLSSGISDSKTEPIIIVFDIDDTLLYENNTAVAEVVALFQRLVELKAHIFLVTARHTSMKKQTILELQSIEIHSSHYKRLLLCPECYRQSSKLIGDWKHAARQSIALEFGVPIYLTVGDQWTDITKISHDEELDALDEVYTTKKTPWILGLVNDGTTILFLKLKSN